MQALKTNQFVGFNNMEPSLIHLETPEQVQLAYAEAASAIDYVNQSKGQTGIRELLAALNERPTPEAIEKTLAISYDTFLDRWKDFLKGKGLKEIEGSRVRRLRVKKDAADEPETVELKEIHSVVARNRTYLADQLLNRGRPVAAVNEYKRALQASPHSPIILNKLGRVLMQMNRHEEALGPLKAAIEVDPDNANTYVQLGRIYHSTKSYKEGRTVLEEALQINPFNPVIYRLLSEIYTQVGEAEKAKQAKWTLDKLAGYPVDVFVNQEPAAVLAANTHAAIRVSPGEHLVRAERASSAVTGVRVQPGESRFVEVLVRRGGIVYVEQPETETGRERIARTSSVHGANADADH